MVNLKQYWVGLKNLGARDPAQRSTLINLSEEFVKAAGNIETSHSAARPANTYPANGQYAIYACSKNMGIANGTHTFLRFVNPDGEIICDIHGINAPKGKDGKSVLSAFIEPREFEHLDHLSDNDSLRVWEGSAEDAAQKMRLAMALVERVNETKPEYRLLSRNCNTLLHSMLHLMDIDKPDMPRWAPGINNLLKDEVAYVERQSGMQTQEINHADWLAQFQEMLDQKREDIIDAFGSLALAAYSSSMRQPKPA